MNDPHPGGLDTGAGEEMDTFTRALLDIAAGRAYHDADLPEEHRQLLYSLADWLPALPDVLAELRTTKAGDDRHLHRPPVEVRPDDPIAMMLGLVVDPDVRLEGRRLATARQAAGLDIAELAERLNRRGWQVSVKTVSGWERNRSSPPPVVVDALAEELGVAAQTLLDSRASEVSSIDALFDDTTIAAFLEDWAREVQVPPERLAEHSKRLLATAGKRNATATSPQALLAVLRQFKALPGFGLSS